MTAEDLDHGGGFDAGDAEDCAKIPREEEDDADPGDGGEGPTESVCTETLVADYVTRWKYKEVISTTCYPLSEDGPLHCNTRYEWKLVPVQVAVWRTETVCTN